MSKAKLHRLTGVIAAALCLQCYLVGAAVAGGAAVSTPNGQLNIGLGAGSNAGVITQAGGSVSVPLGQGFGLQTDFSIENYDLLTGTAALHLFTRDPSSYLAGITAGVVRSNVGTLAAVGAEGELYLNQISLEGWAGYAGLDYDAAGPIDKAGIFAMGDIAYYPTPDFRLSVGASSVLGYQSLSLGAEYQPANLGLPLSFTADARLGQDGKFSALAGLKFYLGDPGKSLIDRQRQDDPPDRGLDLFAAAGAQIANRPAVAGDFPDRTSCEDAGFTWFNSSPEHCG
jgi:hypothetical protein